MIRVFGTALLVAGCAGFGISLSAAHRREAAMLRQLIRGLQEMQWELKYRMTRLPELCRIGADAAGGTVKQLLLELSGRLSRNEVTDIAASFNDILGRKELPGRVRRNLRQFGASLGRYDLEGQLEGLELVRRQCRKDLVQLEETGKERLRSYQTLTVCAGVALAILFL